MFINPKLDDPNWASGQHVLVEYKTQENKTQRPEQTLQYFNYSENDSQTEFTFIFNSNEDSSRLSICSNIIARISFGEWILFKDSEKDDSEKDD
jgi:hypothetical protein